MLNRKHEMFLNTNMIREMSREELLNRKHEMFLNNPYSNASFFS